MKCLVIEFSDGDFAVPVSVIAKDRAENYKGEFGDDLDRSLAEDTLPLFEADEYEIMDWAANCMDWKDLKGYAVKFRELSDVCHDTEFGEAEMKIEDVGDRNFAEAIAAGTLQAGKRPASDKAIDCCDFGSEFIIYRDEPDSDGRSGHCLPMYGVGGELELREILVCPSCGFMFAGSGK